MSVILAGGRKRRSWLREWWAWRRRRPAPMLDGRYHPRSWDQFYDQHALWMLDRPPWRR